jgi:hypothetical protein
MRLIALWMVSLPLGAQVCTHATDGRVDTAYYEANSYVVSKIVLHQTFDFLYFVRGGLEKLKAGLPIKEGERYTRELDRASFDRLKSALNDDAISGVLPFKVTAGLSDIEKCDESAQPRALEVHYYLFSTDPFLAAAMPPERRAGEERNPTKAAENSMRPSLRIVPSAAYDRTDRLAFGGTVQGGLGFPGFQTITLSSTASSSTRSGEAQLSGDRQLGMAGLDRLDYHLQYSTVDQPAGPLQLKDHLLGIRAIASTRDFTFHSGNRIGYRYGLSIAAGNQQSTAGAAAVPPGTIPNSREVDARFLFGTTYTTRYTALSASYALRVFGPGPGSLTSAANIADAKFDWRQGKTHVPWDISARATAGTIAGSRDLLLNGRFFGGNAVAPFLPGDSWMVPYGPWIRSIPRNRLNGLGYGGTSFYSANLTAGKVLKSSPLIPGEIETAPGFADAIRAAENSAENFFADDYETSSNEYKALVAKFGAQFIAHLNAVRTLLHSIPSSPAVRAAGTQMRGAFGVARAAIEGSPLMLRTFTNPNTSKVMKLLDDLQKLAPEVPAAQQAQIQDSMAALKRDVQQFSDALAAMDRSPTASAARARAQRDMRGPREVIDTLRHEADVWSLSAVGIFDMGRLWPDPMGTRYAIGAGARISILSVNFTAGYAVNPQPYRTLGQGRGAVFLSITYTNMFR